MKTFLSILLLLLMTLPGISAEARDRGGRGSDADRASEAEIYNFKSDYLPKRHEREDTRKRGRSGMRLSSDDAARIAGKHFKGRILGVKADDGIWRVKMLNARGEVRILAVDDKTGEVISPR